MSWSASPKKNQNPSMYKKLKHTVQKEQRKAYWKYIENIIFENLNIQIILKIFKTTV
jgi:hypothetical protein